MIIDRSESEWIGKTVSWIGKEAGIVVEEADERTANVSATPAFLR